MKTNKIIIAALLAILLNSCVYSLFPIYTPETLTYLPELVGSWYDGDTKITFNPYENENFSFSITPGKDEYIVIDEDTIRDQEKVREHWEKELENEIVETLPELSAKGYRMTIIDDEDTIVFQARLAEIGDNLFLDMYPDEANNTFGVSVINNFFPVHSFSKISVEGEKMVLTDFDMEQLRDLFKSNLIRLRHENVDGDILITAQPRELQKFLKMYSEDETVFEEPDEYIKVGS